VTKWKRSEDDSHHGKQRKKGYVGDDDLGPLRAKQRGTHRAIAIIVAIVFTAGVVLLVARSCDRALREEREALAATGGHDGPRAQGDFFVP
jgi:hypothetical protein